MEILPVVEVYEKKWKRDEEAVSSLQVFKGRGRVKSWTVHIVAKEAKKKSSFFATRRGPIKLDGELYFFLIVIKWRLDQLSVNILQNEK